MIKLLIAICLGVALGFGIYTAVFAEQYQDVVVEVANYIDTTFDEKKGYEQIKDNGIYRVDVYETPVGFGYQVITYEKDVLKSVGFGAEAEERTYVQDLYQQKKFFESKK